MKMKPISLILCGLIVTLFASTADAQKDAVYRIKKNGKVSKQSGKVQEITPLSVTLDGEKIPVWEIDKVVSNSEPGQVEKARDRIEGSRYDEALEQLNEVKAGSNPMVEAEVDYYRGLAESKIAFAGGDVSAVDAATFVGTFLKSHPKSHHVIPATELMGRLAMAAGKMDFAKQQFELLTKSRWPEYVAKGQFMTGEVLMRQKKYSEAAAAYGKLIAMQANDDLTQRYKQLAMCQTAKAEAMSGDPTASIAKLEELIKKENPDDKELFAYAYNALGSCYLEAKDLTEAQEKFLFTDLLFDSESTPHAEAVYNLAKIWTKQNQTDRAAEARQKLKSRYRNTWWSAQLN